MGGTSDQIKGRIKEAIGDLIDNRHLKDQGKIDQSGGKVKSAVEHAIDHATEALKDAKR